MNDPFIYINALVPTDIANNTDIDSVGSILAIAINVLLIVVVFVSMIATAYSGIQFITSSGNPDKKKQAANNFTYSLTAMIIVLGAFVLKDAILNLLGVDITHLTNETPGF